MSITIRDVVIYLVNLLANLVLRNQRGWIASWSPENIVAKTLRLRLPWRPWHDSDLMLDWDGAATPKPLCHLARAWGAKGGQ